MEEFQDDVRRPLYSCLKTVILFFVLEIPQMIESGLWDHFIDPWNQNELVFFSLFAVIYHKTMTEKYEDLH
jgi:hypothetical protein